MRMGPIQISYCSKLTYPYRLQTTSSEALLADQAQSERILSARPAEGQLYFVPTLQANGAFPSNHTTPSMEDSLDEFTQLSANFLLDPQYCDMDRIISFQDSFMR